MITEEAVGSRIEKRRVPKGGQGESQVGTR